jgi:hypothetical protein
MVPGLWTRAFSEAGGQLDRARALYIKHRVAQLAEEASEKLRQERRAAAEVAKQKAIAGFRRGFRRLAYGLLAIAFGLVAFIFLIVGLSGPFLTPPKPTIGETTIYFVMAAVFGFVTYVCAKTSRR